MRLNRIMAGLLLSGVVVSTQSAAMTGDSLISKVETVYVRVARGLYIEKKLLKKTELKELWVDVRFATSLPGEPASELFQVPADIAIDSGDLVTTRIGDPTPRELNLIPVVNRVTRLVAKYDTPMAMAFGLSNSKPTQGLFVKAEACWDLTPTYVTYADIPGK